MEEIAIAFLMGFLGSAHCVGMCGGFVLLAGSNPAGSSRPAFRLLAYFGGKTTTYAGLGAVLAMIGSVVPTQFSQFQTAVAILTGLFIVVTGGHMAGLLPSQVLVAPRQASVLVSKMAAQVRRSSTGGRFILGVLNGFLPCGLVYAALGYSLTLNGPGQGALFMAIFGIGTVPALALMGLGSVYLTTKRRAGVIRILGWILIVLGILTIVRATPLMKILMGGM